MAKHTGHCLCGEVKYTLNGDAKNFEGSDMAALTCQCRMCQRSSGAPLVAFVRFPATALTVDKGSPVGYQSSDYGTRYFCPTCGGQLYFRYSPPGPEEMVFVSCGTLDDPNEYPPGGHVWAESAPTWLKLGDGLPSFPQWPDFTPKQE